MKNYFNYFKVIAGLILMLSACKKDELEILDVPFSADKLSVNVGEEVKFSIGSGADALAIYTGDQDQDFAKSRINLIEFLGLTERQLKDSIYAQRIPGLKEYRLFVPNLTNVPADYTLSGGTIELYNGKLVPWDFSNATNSKYLKMNLTGGAQTLSINAKKTVLPDMLRLGAPQLTNLKAVITAPNNNFTPFMSFPDGFKPTDVIGVTVRFGYQIVIDGFPGDILYRDVAVREFLQSYGTISLSGIGGLIDNWRVKNPTRTIANGIDEIRFIFNADDPLRTDDDGDLLDYKGNVYLQEVLLGDPGNMVKSFDKGVAVPFVFKGTTITYPYIYKTPGIYKATLVCSYYGRKKYSGDGYQSGRADEIKVDEYPHERRIKTVTIEVK